MIIMRVVIVVIMVIVSRVIVTIIGFIVPVCGRI